VIPRGECGTDLENKCHYAWHSQVLIQVEEYLEQRLEEKATKYLLCQIRQNMKDGKVYLFLG
jgi:hypothetical protein